MLLYYFLQAWRLTHKDLVIFYTIRNVIIQCKIFMNQYMIVIQGFLTITLRFNFFYKFQLFLTINECI